ncbi:MAG: formate/nitrite transporter family protein [Candidatus Scalindua sp.]|nr:formate/nitrite transporter family protein [Candidatus Scalindua sp.]
MKNTMETFCNMAGMKEDMVKNRLGQYFCLSILAGMYIGFGILLIFTLGAEFASASSVAVKLVMGSAFALALLLVVFAGAELFTGNNMVMFIGAIRGRCGWGMMIWLWVVCYFGNLAGALMLAGVMSCTGLADGNVTGGFIGKVASAKMNAGFWFLFTRGILCNMLVCLAVWMSARAKDDASKIFLIFWCLFAFIACGFEHSIANMTIFGTSLMTIHPDTVSVGGFAWNMLPVTLGNIIGGMFIGGMYCFVTYAPVQEILARDGGRKIHAQDGGVALLMEAMDESDQDVIDGGGDAVNLKNRLQPLLVEDRLVAEGEKVRKQESPLNQVVPQGQLYAQKYITAAESCVKELTQWCDQLSSVLTHLRSQTHALSYDEFSEILIQLQIQRDAQSPIYLKDALVRKLAEEMCPDFEKYARSKGTIKSLAASDILPGDARNKITGFLQLCSKAEATTLKVKNPANYGRELSGAHSLLAEAIYELNVLKFELNENFAALS